MKNLDKWVFVCCVVVLKLFFSFIGVYLMVFGFDVGDGCLPFTGFSGKINCGESFTGIQDAFADANRGGSLLFRLWDLMVSVLCLLGVVVLWVHPSLKVRFDKNG